MVDYGKVRSAAKPEPMVLDDYSVWVHTDIQEIFENTSEGNEFAGYEYRMVQYDKNEFILRQTQENAALQDQVTSTQLALCEVYEMMG